jgi:aquaporin NIP
MSNTLVQRCGAEALGTFVMVFAGCGAVAVGSLSLGGVSAVFGLVVACMIFTTGHISGAHFNPAVTVAFSAGGFLPRREVVPYIAAQIAGSTLAAWAVSLTLGPISTGVTRFTIGTETAFGLEFLLTFFLMFVIVSVATDGRAKGPLAAVAIGGIVAVGAAVGGPVTGASMNPARSLGPAFIAGEMTAIWLYCLAPLLGACAAVFVYRAISRTP